MSEISDLGRKRALLFFLLLCISGEILASLLTETTVTTWYPTLVKPDWTPPNWLFGPVWTVLYIFIAIAGWLIYLEPPSEARTKALWLWGIQLFLNVAWSGFFFTLKSPLLGLIDISLLLLALIMTIYWASKVSRVAAGLLTVYLLWVLFAAALNLTIFRLN